VEIGDIEVVNYRANKKIAHLPFAKLGYPEAGPTPPGPKPPKRGSRRSVKEISPSL
jgi:hypothetical protein